MKKPPGLATRGRVSSGLFSLGGGRVGPPLEAARGAAPTGAGLLIAAFLGLRPRGSRGLQERRGVALATFGVTQHGAAILNKGSGGLRLDHGQGIRPLRAILALAALPFEAFAAGTIVTIAARTVLLAGTLVPLTVIALPILAARPVIALTPAFPAPFALAAVVTVTVAVATLATVVTVAAVVTIAIAVAVLVAVAIAALLAAFSLAVLALALSSLGFGGGGGLGPALVLEVDIHAGGELVAAQNLARRALRLHGAHDPEVMLCVLQIVLGQYAVAGRRGVAGKLLVLLEHVLGVAAHLDAIGPVRVEGPVRVLLLRLAATATSVAAALTLHTLEISHSS